MEWKVIAALTMLGVAIIVGFVIVLYTSVSRYARAFDPGIRAAGRIKVDAASANSGRS
jgi:hypothetical protein